MGCDPHGSVLGHPDPESEEARSKSHGYLIEGLAFLSLLLLSSSNVTVRNAGIGHDYIPVTLRPAFEQKLLDHWETVTDAQAFVMARRSVCI